MTFDTEAILEATVDQHSLREARETVEREVGDIEMQVDVQAGGGRARTDGGRGRGSQAITSELRVEHDLSEERNDLLRALIDETEDSGFSRARSIGGGLAAIAGLLGAGLAGVSSALPGAPNVPPASPSPPDTHFQPPGGGGAAPAPIPAPGGELTRGPSGDVTYGPGGDGTGTPTGGGGPTPEEILGGLAFGGGAMFGLKKFTDGLGMPSPGSSGALPIALPSVLAGQDAGRGRQNGDQKTLLERLFGVEFSAGGGGGTAFITPPVPEGTIRGQGGGARNNQAAYQRRQRSTIEYNPTFEVKFDELKSARDKDIRRLEQRIESLRSSFSDGNGGAGGRLSR